MFEIDAKSASESRSEFPCWVSTYAAPVSVVIYNTLTGGGIIVIPGSARVCTDIFAH